MSTTFKHETGRLGMASLVPGQRLPASGHPLPPGVTAGFRWPDPRTPDDRMVWPRPVILTEPEALLADTESIRLGSVVYYVELAVGPTYGAGRPVKVGFTRRLRKRVAAVAKVWGPVADVLCEPGAYALEQLRHWQFRDSHMRWMPLAGGSEFFEQGAALRAHMDQVRAGMGATA